MLHRIIRIIHFLGKGHFIQWAAATGPMWASWEKKKYLFCNKFRNI